MCKLGGEDYVVRDIHIRLLAIEHPVILPVVHVYAFQSEPLFIVSRKMDMLEELSRSIDDGMQLQKQGRPSSSASFKSV